MLRKKADWINYETGDERIVQLINEAIQYQQKIKIKYNGYWKEISPFAWSTSKDGNTVVKCYTIPGEGSSMDSDDNGLNTRSYRVDKITNVKPLPGEDTDKGKYNKDYDAMNEYDDLQNNYDKNFGNDKYVAKTISRLKKIAENEEYGPDDVKLKKSIDGYPVGTICTIMDIDYRGKLTLQVNDDGHEIITTKGNVKRLDGQPIEANINFKLKRLANEDEMNFDQIKEETIKAIQKMRTMVTEWSVRDTLKDFTQWDFYKGETMVSLNGDIARNICDQLLDYVYSISERDEYLLYEVADKVSHYMY